MWLGIFYTDSFVLTSFLNPMALSLRKILFCNQFLGQHLQRQQLFHGLSAANQAGAVAIDQHFGNQGARVVVR